MSVEAIDWALKLRGLTSAQKFVLLGLANHANPDGTKCHPSIARIAKYTAFSERHVTRIIRDLEATGLVSVEQKSGKKSEYILHVGAGEFHAELLTPRHPRQHVTPDTVSGEPLTNETQTPDTVSPKPSINRQLTVHKEGARKRASRLQAESPPDDWIEFAEKQGLDADETFDEFRDYWIAQPGQKGTKLDWTATWRNWCRRQKQFRRAGGDVVDFRQFDG